jgi:peroxiredoxin
MKKSRMKLLAKNIVFGLVLMGSVAYSALPLVDARAPDFALKANNGTNIRLSEYRGQVVLLNFWASWCRSCRTEIPHIMEIAGDPASGDLQVLGINIDEQPELAESISRELGINYPVLFDDAQAVSKLYDLPTLPVTLLLDRGGEVRFMHSGYKPGDEIAYMNELSQLLAE